MQLAVFLDRDNTLIHNDGDLGRPDDVRLIHGVGPGLRALRDAGFALIVVTNQAGVARGVFTEEDVDAVHQRIAMLIDEAAQKPRIIDRFYYCPYHPEGAVAEYRRDHLWRKPHPGMILQAARDVGIGLPRSWMIGDQERDVQAGRSAGCRTILITHDEAMAKRAAATAVSSDFAGAVRIILNDLEQVRHNAAAPIAAPAATTTPTPAPSTPSPPQSNGSSSAVASLPSNDIAALRRSINELSEEVRSDRMRRVEFTALKMLAGLCQLLAALFAVLGLLQISTTDAFVKWMLGAALAQLVTITLLVLGLRT